nr:RICIN domain-containing protein [Cellulomonas septica]
MVRPAGQRERAGDTAGTRVQLWDCNGGTNQQWTSQADGTIRGVRSGLCLDVDRNLTANNTAVLLWKGTRRPRSRRPRRARRRRPTGRSRRGCSAGRARGPARAPSARRRTGSA